MENDLLLEKQNLVLKLGSLPREMAVNSTDQQNKVGWIGENVSNGMLCGGSGPDVVRVVFTGGIRR